MPHTRKKAGERKDKKTARMREAEEFKHGMAKPKKKTSDQWDVQSYKPGHASDKTSPQNRPRGAKKKG
ncbi:MAG TPA: hypothetical protein VNI20_04720 [Fimbriimonadaceae bacterium]|nr:hypothetical protein [Fimbriimonadaceae bacterium]